MLRAFRTSKYYFYFTVLQLMLTLILLILLLFLPHDAPHLLLETAIGLLLLADLYLLSYSAQSN